MEDRIILVNQADEIIGDMEKLQAHQKGLLHRAFSIFICRQNPKTFELELLLQQREKNKYHSGGLWTNTCCSHPAPGESMRISAEKRLHQEMGFTVPLIFLGKFYYRVDFENGLSEHEWDYVFVGKWSGQPILFNPQEVQNYRWENLKWMTEDIKNQPQHYTFWLNNALDFILKKQHFIAKNLFKG